MYQNLISEMLQKHRRWTMLVQIFFIYAWLSNLPKTDSFFSIYVFYALAGFFCMFDNMQKPQVYSFRASWKQVLLAAFFSISVILGNHFLFAPFTALMSLFNMALSFVGGIVIGFHILQCVMNHFPMDTDQKERTHAVRFFTVSFLTIVFLDILYLFTTNYPAILNYDAVAQLAQIQGVSSYSNWTPYWHTKTLEVVMTVGKLFFRDINAVFAFYEVCQIVFIGAVFSYTLVTLYQIGIPKPALFLAFFLYALLPYNIIFNVTIGKDVLFGIGLLLCITAFYRICTETGKMKWLNYIAFAAGSVGFCMWRTNGWPIYLLFTIAVFWLFRKQRKLLILLMCCILVFCWYFLNPYLDARDVEQAPVIETMAVPFQQIARVIVNEREIADEDQAFLSQIFYLDQFQELYEPGSVDNIKFKAFRHSQTEFFKENLGTFLNVWIRLGLRYPGDYLLAWADETRGYWNGGYHMGVYDQGLPENAMGSYNTDIKPTFHALFSAYIRYIEDPVILEPLKSIGFTVWLIIPCFWMNIWKQRHVSVLFIPVCILLIGLWLGTPVYAEFRYAYPIFVTSPLLIFTTIYQTDSIL